MSVTTLETVLRRDRVIVAAALAAIVMFSWVYIIILIWRMGHAMPMPAGDAMGNMDMSGMAMAGATMLTTPHFAELPVLILMWSVMMIGMMTPSASPMILLYARVARQAAAKGQPFAATSWFMAGYLLAWIGFSIIASVAQVWLQREALLTSEMGSANRLFSGFLLLAAGIFQWAPLKDACLSECRMPLSFIQQHGGFRPETGHSLRLGFLHGGYCVGCCWALMALLFVGGVMNVFWIMGLSILVLLEKMLPFGRSLARVTGVALLIGAGWILIGELA